MTIGIIKNCTCVFTECVKCPHHPDQDVRETGAKSLGYLGALRRNV